MDDTHTEEKEGRVPGVQPVRVAASPFSSVVPSRVKTDPPTRQDGRCIQCEKRRPPTAVEFDDPFCSSDCCRAFYGCPLRDAKPKAKQGPSTLRRPAVHVG
jgi:hypothetical protein